MRPALVALLLAGCAVHASPKAVLTDYLEAEQAGRYEVAHALLTSTDREARPLPAYVAEHVDAGSIWLAIAARTTFRPGAVTEADDHVLVPVDATHADPRALEQALRESPAGDLSLDPDPEGATRTWVRETLDAYALPTVTDHLVYGLRQEGDAWRVWLALDRQDACVDAVVRARRAEASGDAMAAAKAWGEVLTLPTDPGGVVASFQELARTKVTAP